jgi:predicted thioesterase
MNLSELIQPGASNEERFTVTEQITAYQVGSGSARVLATPWLIGYMERTAHRLLTCCLPEGQTSVGTLVNVRHLAPTPLGVEVRVEAVVISLEGNRVYFKVRAWDEIELVGEGEHERAVIEEARFLRRVEKKQAALDANQAG